ncbi:MAG: phosphoribosylformylglycinamidine synthase II, partial [Propionibacteriaceae bacterium]|nr:phosphoribosylformylglycinamidine synthase II [Propionibacteriaceae bacterium]
ALSEAYRNVAATGAEPIAITDCLNFGSPEDASVMWQFVEAIKGLVDGCAALGTPVTGGNVSFYNQTGTTNIHPTPVVGMLGVFDDVRCRVTQGFKRADDAIFLLGETKDELGGSVWEDVIHHGHLGGFPPYPNLEAEKSLATVLITAARTGLLSSAHDLSEGGLAQALTECCLLAPAAHSPLSAHSAHSPLSTPPATRTPLGAEVALPGALDPTSELFSETPARALISIHPDHISALESLAAEYGVPLRQLGTVTATPTLEITGAFTIDIAELRPLWESPLPTAMNH